MNTKMENTIIKKMSNFFNQAETQFFLFFCFFFYRKRKKISATHMCNGHFFLFRQGIKFRI